MNQRIFISSVQREFAKERKAIAEMIRKDMLLPNTDLRMQREFPRPNANMTLRPNVASVGLLSSNVRPRISARRRSVH